MFSIQVFSMLEDFIQVNRLTAKIFPTTQEVHTAARAAALMGSDAEAVAKSILLIDSNAQPLLVVLLGKDRIDFQKVKALLGVSDVRLAGQQEVYDITGYEIGGVPPISIYGVRTIMDRQVAKKEEVVCGGGDPQHLMRIKVTEILESVEEISIEDVRK